jgi:hypothetical protein
MVSTRSQKTDDAAPGDKRTAPTSTTPPSKKAKTTKNQKLQVGENGDVELKQEAEPHKSGREEDEDEVGKQGDKDAEALDESDEKENDSKAKGEAKDGRGGPSDETAKGGATRDGEEDQESATDGAKMRSGTGESTQKVCPPVESTSDAQGDELDAKTRGESPGAELDEPKHGMPLHEPSSAAETSRDARIRTYILPLSAQNRCGRG